MSMEFSRVEEDVEFLRQLKRSYGIETEVDILLKHEAKAERKIRDTEDFETYVFSSSKKSQFSERAIEYRESLFKVSSGYYAFLDDLKILSLDEQVSHAETIESGLYAAELIESGEIGFAKKEDLITLIAKANLAQEAFVLHNLKLVRSTAMKLRNLYPQLDIEELFQSGVLGLIRAMQKWDWQRGYTFSTYATWWIRQSIYRDIQDNYSLIRLPVHLWENIKFDKENQEWIDGKKGALSFQADGGIWASLHLESIQKLEKEKYFENLDYSESNLEISKLEDSLVSRAILRELLQFLSQTDLIVIVKRFGLLGREPMTLDEIGKEEDVTRERIRQIEAKAIVRVQNLVIRNYYEYFECRSHLLEHFSEDIVNTFEEYWYIHLTSGRVRQDSQIRAIRVDSKRKLESNTNAMIKEMTSIVLERIYSYILDSSLLPKSTFPTN